MNIRARVSILIAGIFVILGLAALTVGKLVIMPSFAQLERVDARTAMRRIDHALSETLAQVAVASMDWGNWADTYRFVEDRNPQFVSANITAVALKQLDVNALLIVSEGGKVLLARDDDLATDRPLGLDLTARAALPNDFPWRASQLDGHAVKGLLRTNKGILLLAAAPILDGNGGGPARGMVLMGRLLGTAALHGIADQAQANLAMLPPRAGTGEQIEETDTQTRVYQSFADVYGRPVMAFRVDVPREVTMRGKAAVKVASICLIAAAVVVLILLVVVLNRVILDPLALVTRHAVAISEGADGTPLGLQRADEIGVLAREFDRMVQRVTETRMQLVDQSFQAGFAELARGVLHNLGNAMTPLGVRLANLGERLRSAPAEDAEQAVNELQSRGCCDPARKADLEEFLRLACKELAVTVRAAQEDVAVMGRQTTVVQSTLTEQMRAARNEHVIEPVRLTELVSQSLEIVPDACRQRLTVDTDETVRRLGVVRVARTVLRLILQNLIINAADAVRDAGKDKGVLRVSAEIVREHDMQQLHLQCKDDGVGIAPQNLERVFEKGFSTKSPETNHGIGLHWCANAVSALGGRIWAASEGPGRGASMHLMVPLVGREPGSLAGAH